jgi:hypothetical protein
LHFLNRGHISPFLALILSIFVIHDLPRILSLLPLLQLLYEVFIYTKFSTVSDIHPDKVIILEIVKGVNHVHP